MIFVIGFFLKCLFFKEYIFFIKWWGGVGRFLGGMCWGVVFEGLVW